MLYVGMPRCRWIPNLRLARRCVGDGTTTGARQLVQLRVKARRHSNVCGPDEVNLVTMARGEPVVGTPTGGR